jgi:hypothetical protein
MYDHVIWPARFDPKTSAIYALNAIDVKAPPDVVWKLLVDAENWSSYFPAEDQVRILTGEKELALGRKYCRVTVGFPMSLVVTEYVPDHRLAWKPAGAFVREPERRRSGFSAFGARDLLPARIGRRLAQLTHYWKKQHED